MGPDPARNPELKPPSGPQSCHSREVPAISVELLQTMPEEAIVSLILDTSLRDSNQNSKFAALYEKSNGVLDETKRRAIAESLSALIQIDARFGAALSIRNFIETCAEHEKEALEAIVQTGAFEELVLLASVEAIEISSDLSRKLLKNPKLPIIEFNDLLERLSLVSHLQNGIDYQELKIIKQGKKYYIARLESTLQTLNISDEVQTDTRSQFRAIMLGEQ